MRLINNLIKNKKRYYQLFGLFGLLFLYGCPDSVNSTHLESNKVKIDDSLQGGWDISYTYEGKLYNAQMEIKKKDDYWAYVNFLADDLPSDTNGLTIHKFDDRYFGCLSGWENGRKLSSVYLFEFSDKNTLKVYDLDISFDDHQNLNNTPLDESESVFLSYFRNGKIKIGKAYYYYKKYDLDD